MIVLDATVLIAYLDGEDAHGEEALRILTAAVGQSEDLGASTLTLAEVLVGPAAADRLSEVQGALADIGIEEIRFPEDAAVRLAALRASTKAKMPDCCVLLAAECADAAMATFDDGLKKAAKRRGIVLFEA